MITGYLSKEHAIHPSKFMYSGDGRNTCKLPSI